MSEEQQNQEAQESQNQVDVQVVDDTPPEDRGRTPLPQNLVQELEQDDLEEYSEKVKKRLGQMKKVWHDERREKERAAREREEALNFAKAQFEENKKLKSQLHQNHQAYYNQVTYSTKQDLDGAKRKLKEAYESGDSEAITNAQEELTDIKLRAKEIERFRPATRQEQENTVQNQQQTAHRPAQPKPDPKAVSWAQKNTWFGQNEEMTALALGLHERLVRSGVDPNSDEYYREVDQTIRKRFPEAFPDATPRRKPERERAVSEQQSEPASNPPPNVVAPATRVSSDGTKAVFLTNSQLALAKKLGLSAEAYAREVAKIEGMM
jgi:hypothetical protein